ncbi:hypothetical protein ANCDUO_18114 [Ancylostoma duodenale]|uniref:Uncharacterized protein n=1 Tax=Ancylostoma duodenale TaxID=51022 RepID=A0A0C2C678_9BILA|nr:hypothetical protein ANCDUO_18114 [Ancylostoma duodenale]
MAALEEVRALTDEFHDYGCEKRKGQIARNVEKHDRPRATSDDVPEGLRTLMDGSNYLQYSRSGLYIYYSKETIKVADGSVEQRNHYSKHNCSRLLLTIDSLHMGCISYLLKSLEKMANCILFTGFATRT